MTLSSDANVIAEAAFRLAAAVAERDSNGLTFYDRIHDSFQGHPRAAAWDNGPRTSIIWCDHHGQSVTDCHTQCMPCTGTPLVGQSDPTGDAAIRPDVAAGDLRNFKRALGRITRDLDLLTRIVQDYTPHQASEYEKALTRNLNDPHCESCVRIEGHIPGEPRWVEPTTKERSTQNGRLEKAVWLCGPCERHVISKGCIPNEDELEQIRQGKLKRCPHPNIEQKDTAA